MSPLATRVRGLYEANRIACEYYERTLLTDEHAREYLTGRGIGLETINEFRLGYASTDRSALPALLAERCLGGFAEEVGLIHRTFGGEWRDRLNNKITFPIFHERRCVGFSSRTVADDTPKYINSPDSLIFHKSELFYRPWDYCPTNRTILVEGNIDCLQLYQAGFRDTLATLGTALTEHHIEALRTGGNRVVYLLFDGDTAGQRAVFNACRTAFRACTDSQSWLRVAYLPEGEDPDTFIRIQGPQGIEKRLDNAVDPITATILALDLSSDKLEQQLRQTVESAMSEVQQLLLAKRFGEFLKKDLTPNTEKG